MPSEEAAHDDSIEDPVCGALTVGLGFDYGSDFCIRLRLDLRFLFYRLWELGLGLSDWDMQSLATNNPGLRNTWFPLSLRTL